MAGLLPPEFSDLEPFVRDWCFDGEPQLSVPVMRSVHTTVLDASLPGASDTNATTKAQPSRARMTCSEAKMPSRALWVQTSRGTPRLR